MTIAQVRRKINDSYLGQKVNHSVPGILVEGSSRAISDALKEAKYQGMILGASLVGRKSPLKGLALGGATLVEAMGDQAREMDPETHYSHTSALYRKVTREDGSSYMERIPVTDALLEKIAEYSPQTALQLALATSPATKDAYQKPVFQIYNLDKRLRVK